MKVKDIKPNLGDEITVYNKNYLCEKEYTYRDGRYGVAWYRGISNYIWENCDWEVLEYKPAMDLTKIEKPFGLLDKDTQEALKNHRGEIEMYNPVGWRLNLHPQWSLSATYRAAPEPEVKEMTVEQISKELGYEVKIVK